MKMSKRVIVQITQRDCCDIYRYGIVCLLVIILKLVKMHVRGIIIICVTLLYETLSRLRLKCHDTRAETTFRLSAKRTSPFKSSRGRQFGRLLTVELCSSEVLMLDTPCSEVV